MKFAIRAALFQSRTLFILLIIDKISISQIHILLYSVSISQLPIAQIFCLGTWWHEGYRINQSFIFFATSPYISVIGVVLVLSVTELLN